MKKLFIAAGIIGGLSLFSTSCQPEIITPVDQTSTDSTSTDSTDISNPIDSTNVNTGGDGNSSSSDSTIVTTPGDSTNNNGGSGWNPSDSLDNNGPSTDSLGTGG